MDKDSTKQFNELLNKAFSRRIQSGLLSRLDKIKSFLVMKSHVQQFKILFPNASVETIQESSIADCIAVGPRKPSKQIQKMLNIALAQNIPILSIEDAFFRSADTWANRQIDKKFTMMPQGIMLDQASWYFDGSANTSIQKVLADPAFKLTEGQLKLADQCIKMIVEKKLTKYNHQPIYQPSFGKPGRSKVLVVDQSYGDASVALGQANDKTFKEMLQAAIRQNPDADILVKTHPDTLAGQRKCYYSDVDQKKVVKVQTSINPQSLLSIVDKVYVCTTQFGFQALLAGKQVHVFGLPFYAGWGQTVDNVKCQRRTTNRSIQEIFYAACILNTKWIDYQNREQTTMLKALSQLQKRRDQYFKEFFVRDDDIKHQSLFLWCVDSDLNNNLMALASIESMVKNSTQADFMLMTLSTNPMIKYFSQIKPLKVKLIDKEFKDNFAIVKTNHTKTILSSFTFARFLAFKLDEFKEYQTVIYLDNDTIARRSVDKNLLDVVKSSKTTLMMVPEQEKSKKIPQTQRLKRFCSSKGLQYSGKLYGNAGLVAIKPRLIPKDCFQKLVDLIKVDFQFNDQDILNVFFDGQITPLKPKYNYFKYTKTNSQQKPVIVHYCGGAKKSTEAFFGEAFFQLVFNLYLR